MKVNLASLVAVVLLAASVPGVSSQTKTDGSKSVEFKTAQVWTTNQNITVAILGVEDVHGVGSVIHVRVDKIPWQRCGGVRLTRAIEHLALTEKMMLKSALVLTRDNADLPESSVEAYRKWQRQKNHEIYKVPLQKAILGSVPPMICNFVPGQT
jgi:hypothetical protein